MTFVRMRNAHLRISLCGLREGLRDVRDRGAGARVSRLPWREARQAAVEPGDGGLRQWALGAACDAGGRLRGRHVWMPARLEPELAFPRRRLHPSQRGSLTALRRAAGPADAAPLES